ncbi:hypothetical protein B6D23_05275 [Gilliamella sp. N-W3]|uniref:hypothetical protein n=1 Tax=Gilliamella sp. N-W3 TaxID=1970474 RepID=UPI000A35B4D8|nr:hypothetical protein [Gilliamella sp. N-W3]OTQ79445.1 hypothetical protein B6D23_05275 [Gilliamella sp. N-W3]
MEKFLEFLDAEGCEYEIQDGAIRVLDTLEPYEVRFDNIVIPENTDFTKGLDLECYEGDIQFPESFKVANILALRDTSIKRLPSNLTLYNYCSVYVDAHKIENVSYSDRCGFLGRTIFAFWANNDFLIAAGCFTGTYSEFEERIKTARYYSKADATEYKRKVRGCISRLAKKLGKPDPFKKATAN